VRLLKTIASRVLLALASNPALAGPRAEPEPKQYVHDAGDQFLVEMGATAYASHRPELHARYDGHRTALPEQLRAMAGRRLSNGCLVAREEMAGFVEARTR
jgi:hypothetical protein